MTHIKDHPGKSYIAGGLPILISRWLYLAAAVYTPLACGGALYGWANMSYMLEKEGYFLSECEEGVASCTDQALALNGIFNVGSICSFVAPIFVGLLMARGGPRAAQGVTAFVFFLGALLATLSATAGSSTALMYAAFACFGLGASSALLGLYNVSNMFPGREGLVMGIVNGSFDAGTIVFLVMRALYDSGISFRTVLLAYLCGPALLLLLIVLVLWRKEPFLPIQEENEKLAALKAAAAQPGVTPASAAAVVVPLVPTADAQRPGVVAEKSGAMSAASSQAGVEHVVVSPSGVTVLVQGARGARASIP
ncbi:MFS transporter, partial [archaeon]